MTREIPVGGGDPLVRVWDHLSVEIHLLFQERSEVVDSLIPPPVRQHCGFGVATVSCCFETGAKTHG